jgi:hypothetical protein
MRYSVGFIGNAWDRSGVSAVTALPSYVIATVVGPAHPTAPGFSPPAAMAAARAPSRMTLFRWLNNLHRPRLPS